MATIFSNADGQVVEASDDAGTYYYLTDGLGEPTVGWWANREDAVAALEGTGAAEIDGEIDERGNRLAAD